MTEREWRLSQLPPMQREIERLMDEGRYIQAAQLARQERDAASDERLRRRYHGLYLFAASRLAQKGRQSA